MLDCLGGQPCELSDTNDTNDTKATNDCGDNSAYVFFIVYYILTTILVSAGVSYIMNFFIIAQIVFGKGRGGMTSGTLVLFSMSTLELIDRGITLRVEKSVRVLPPSI
jgi:hypothetical protein